PDNFLQEVVARYGLSEQALQFLERLNAALNMDNAEKDRILAKVKGFEQVTEDEGLCVPMVFGDKDNEHALSMLNDVLTTPTGWSWETYGLQILTAIYDYCHREFTDIKQPQNDATGRTTHTITPEEQRSMMLVRLNEITVRLRDKLTGGDKNGKHSKTVNG
ncbi:MAG: hypothetical protein LBL83_09320, partial [Clostridiales bacterium]|nr:hypothetical protein [Clostridiales bacterium]